MALNGGKKSDYAERLKRQRKTSAVKFYLVAIILGGLIGLAYIKRVELVAVYNSVMNPTPPAAPQQPVAPPVTDKVAPAPVEPQKKKLPDVIPIPPKPPATVAVEPSISLKDEAKARQLLDEGKAFLEVFDFGSASQRFEQASSIKLGAALKEETKTWKQKAVAFQNATKHIPIADYAKTDKAILIETTSGDELRGIQLQESNDSIYVQQVNDANPASEGIQKFPIPLNEVKKITPISSAKRRADFGELVLSQESGTTISHSTDYYDLVYLCKRLGLGKECMMYLNRAYDGGPGHAPDPELGDSLRKVVVRRAIGRATLQVAGNHRVQATAELKKLADLLPDFAPASEEIASIRSQVMDKVKSDFHASLRVDDNKVDTRRSKTQVSSEPQKSKQPVREESLAVVVESVTSNGAASKVLERGNAKFGEGMGVIRKYTVGVGGNKNDNNRILLQAKGLLLEAIDIYEDALKLEPGNHAIQDRQQTASQMVYFCNKNLIL